MKKELIVLALVFFNIIGCLGQGFNNLFGSNGTEVFNSVKETADGGYLAIGSTTSWGSGHTDALVVKFSVTGNIVWSKTYGLLNVHEEVSEIEITTTGNYMLAGTTRAEGSDYRDVMLLEIDPNGLLVWSKTLGSTQNDYVRSIVKTTDGGFVICGDNWTANNVNSGDYFMIKLDASRNISWQKKFYYSSINGDIATKVIPASDGGYYFVGHSYFSNDYDQIIIKFDNTGTKVWAKRIGRVYDDATASVFELANGDIMVAGNIRHATTAALRSSLIRMTSAGGVVWSKEYSAGVANVEERTYGFIQASNGDFVITGHTLAMATGGHSSKQLLVFRTNNTGNVIFGKSYGKIAAQNASTGNEIIQTGGGDLVAVGYATYAGFGLNDSHILKMNSSGNVNDEQPCNSPGIIEQNTTYTVNGDVVLTYQTPSFAIANLSVNTITFTTTLRKFPDCNIDICEVNPINYSGLPTVICPNSPPITLVGNQTTGNFAIATTNIPGGILVPGSFPDGVKTVTYTSTSVPAGCTNSISKKTLIVKGNTFIDRVISSSSTTYSDAWPMDYANCTNIDQQGRNNLELADEVRNGTKGIWHGEESFVYVEKREQNAPLVKIKEDGIYNDMPLFDHASAVNGGCSPKWRLVNTMTEYNPFSYELENRDILNRHTAALFGYEGELSIAVASNAREREIAYESFEEYTPGASVTPGTLSSGNLAVYVNAVPGPSDFYKVYRPYEIIEAIDNVLTVDFPYSRALSWNGRIVRLTGGEMNAFDTKSIYGKYTISSVKAHATDVMKSVVTLSPTGFAYTGIWKGKISVPVDYATTLPVFTGTSNLSIVSSKKHTGKNSLKSTGDASFEQIMMDLIPGEKYVLSAWVSTDQDNYTYRVLSGPDRRGFTAEYLDKNGNSLGTTPIDIEDKNLVIEGWQKIEGVFEFPALPVKAERLVIHFKSPAGTTTYWDDIRFFPFNGNIQTYVYDKLNYKVSAILDNNNYASLYYYDAQGNLFLIKKETEKGIQTIQESFSHQKQ